MTLRPVATRAIAAADPTRVVLLAVQRARCLRHEQRRDPAHAQVHDDLDGGAHASGEDDRGHRHHAPPSLRACDHAAYTIYRACAAAAVRGGSWSAAPISGVEGCCGAAGRMRHHQAPASIGVNLRSNAPPVQLHATKLWSGALAPILELEWPWNVPSHQPS
jgi:hypothetical protein